MALPRAIGAPLHSGRWSGLTVPEVAPPDRRRGLLYMVGAAVLFSVMGTLVKAGSATMPSMQLVFGRVAFTLIIGWVTIAHAGVSPWGVNRGMLFRRGVLGGFALVCFYESLAVLPLGDATAIQYTNPILSAVLAAWLLRERVAWTHAVATALSIAGVVAIARPSFIFGGASLPTMGVLAAVAGAILSAFVYVTVRQLGETEHPYVIVFWFPLVAFPVVTPLALRVWVWPDAWGWAILLGIGVSTQIAQVLMTKGLHLLPVAQATAVSYLQVALGFIVGALFFAEQPSLGAVAGAVLILAGMVVTSRR